MHAPELPRCERTYIINRSHSSRPLFHAGRPLSRVRLWSFLNYCWFAGHVSAGIFVFFMCHNTVWLYLDITKPIMTFRGWKGWIRGGPAEGIDGAHTGAPKSENMQNPVQVVVLKLRSMMSVGDISSCFNPFHLQNAIVGFVMVYQGLRQATFDFNWFSTANTLEWLPKR